MSECFYTILDSQSEEVFYLDEEKKYTYAQLWDFIIKSRHYFKEKGIKANQKVLLSCCDPLNFIVGFLTIISMDSCAVLIENKKKEQEILEILDQTDSKVILTDHQISCLISEKVDVIKFDATNQPNEIDDRVGCNMDLDGCIIYTSGSSSKPKGVIRSNRILFGHASMLKKIYNLSCDDTVLSMVQPQHAFGLENSLAAIYSGSTLIIKKDFSHNQILRLIEEKVCSVIVGVPYQYNLLVQINKKILVNRLRYLLSAGAPLKKEINTAIYELFGIPITQIYGSSELGAIAINVDIAKEFQYESVGKPLSEVTIKIIDEKDCILPYNHIGEIVIKSPYCTNGYLGTFDIDNDAYMHDGWFFSGDLGYVSEKNYLFITGRKKNVLNIAGKKVSPEEVEKVIKKLESIEDVKVESEKNSLYGEAILAKVVMKRESKLSENEVLNHCKKCLSDYKIPRKIIFTDKLEYTATGKLKR